MSIPLSAALFLISVGLLATVLYTFVVAVRRLYFHPLSKFPGPKLHAISAVPTILSLVKGRLPMDNKKLHDKYAWEDIYGHRNGHLNMRKDPIHAGAVQAVRGVTSLQYDPDDANHARQRRALAYSFSVKALAEQEGIVLMYCDKLVENMRRLSKGGKSLNICDWLNFATFDIIGDLAFAESFGCLDTGDFHFWVKLVFEAVKGGAFVQATRRFATTGSPLQKVLLRCFKDVSKPIRKHAELSRIKVMKRLENDKSDHRDFIWYILQQKEKFDITEAEIVANSALFILAGSETTANALSGLIARLLWNPMNYEKLVQEIRSTFTSEAEINHDTLLKMPYLNACIEEGLRIHPPISPGLVRLVPDGGDSIDGQWIPAGTTVSVGSWAASHNPANFKLPDAFIPERWFDEAYASDLKRAMRPFSLGPRGCIGKNLAYMELRLIIGRLLWSFDIVSTDGAPQWDPADEVKNMRAFMVWATPELNVTLVPAVR